MCFVNSTHLTVLVIFYLQAAIIYMVPLKALSADANESEIVRQVMGDQFENLSLAQVQSNHIDIEAQLPKWSFKISEPIILKSSLWNRTYHKLNYADFILPIANYDISIREKSLGNLPLNKFGARLKQPHGVMMSSMPVSLTPWEAKEYSLDLREIFDINVGSYEVFLRRRLFLRGKVKVDLNAEPIKFEVTN